MNIQNEFVPLIKHYEDHGHQIQSPVKYLPAIGQRANDYSNEYHFYPLNHVLVTEKLGRSF